MVRFIREQANQTPHEIFRFVNIGMPRQPTVLILSSALISMKVHRKLHF
jgi:hypothetical protein